MKRLNKTHIFHIFFGLLMFLPFISILSRVIYVQSNKNAKDSYSGNYEITYKYQSNQVNSVNDLVKGNIYELKTDSSAIPEFITPNRSISFRLLTPLELDTHFSYTIDDVLSGAITVFDTCYIMNMFYDGENSYINIYSSNYDYYNNDFYISIQYNGFYINDCVIQLLDFVDNPFVNYSYLTYTDYNEIESINLTGTLDNAFDYSISKFIEDNNFKINFFSWFEDLFLVQNGGVNALYLSFANWYMCYALLVSTGYLLFLILMWFINYVRKILEGGNSFGHGGF